jgi:tRNA pseudouridine55 synthase
LTDIIDFNEGQVLFFNKPYRWTSFDLVRKVKNVTRAKKVGHAGTLDPLATGLMIICTGKMTRQVDFFQAKEKEYTGSFRLGITTPCYDLEQPADKSFDISHITERAIYDTCIQFTGTIMQIPPPHSAVKINGKRAYEAARAGKNPEMKAREVTISVFEITAIQMPSVFFRVVCSKGTYIRSLAHDFGAALQSGACLESLCRTRIGEFKLSEAMTIEDFIVQVKGADS